MHRYSVYGKCLASELELPQLSPAVTEIADWTLRVAATPPELTEARLVGSEQIGPIGTRLIRHRDGYRLEYDDTGAFDVSTNGRDVWWYAKAGVDQDLLCADLTGKVLAVAFHIRGKLALHGSAVLLGEEGVAFLAPKGFGKSTLSIALTRAGARLASDDMVTVEPGQPVRAWPGLDSVRLWRHTAEALKVDDLVMTLGAGRKFTISQFPEARLVREPFPLTAIYLLNPVQAVAEGAAAVTRTRLDPVASVLAVVPNTKLGPLLGDSEAPVVLQRTASLMRHVPVYRLAIVREFDRLSEVVDQLFAWHGAAHLGTRVLEAAS